MATGKVKWFDAGKGYGFITPDDGGADVFVHHSSLSEETKTLDEGQAVEFETEPTPRGSKATSVKAI